MTTQLTPEQTEQLADFLVQLEQQLSALNLKQEILTQRIARNERLTEQLSDAIEATKSDVTSDTTGDEPSTPRGQMIPPPDERPAPGAPLKRERPDDSPKTPRGQGTDSETIPDAPRASRNNSTPNRYPAVAIDQGAPKRRRTRSIYASLKKRTAAEWSPKKK